MAEIKNTFIKSKMNKDLDDRLVPNGEYRDALNIAISRSENDDVGALETILGNELYFGEQTYNTCIGAYVDRQNKRVYYFVTNYIDTSANGISNFAPTNAFCAVEMYDAETFEKTTLVKGSFLNFSARSPIIGVNIIEDLLFWTDNRNQPRKINITNASAFPAIPAIAGRSAASIPQPYYTNEDQISVAKYYPWKAISLMNINDVAVGITPTNSTMTNPTQEYYANGSSPKPDYDANWPGDRDFLSDKFIRLSYRFKFDDNEYSLMAPFTQPCYIPKQNGYFLSGDGEKTYKSTIVEFFENNVTQIVANIEFETLNPEKDYKIKEVQILYKESNALQVQAIENIPIDVVMEAMAANTNQYVYDYKYISNKPYKNIPENQITRVYDKVPTRALAQEVSGNRVIYGNFYTNQTPPKDLDYSVAFGNKTGILSVSEKEYPNHTVKQNRSYQVGFVLADKYGRQSDVILSSRDVKVDDGAGNFYGGSTVYVPYKGNSGTSVLEWPGYALRTLINAPIPTIDQYNAQGYPGLYQDANYGVDSLVTSNPGSLYTPSAGTVYPTTGGSGTGLTVKVSVTGGGGAIDTATVVNPGSGYTNGDIVTIVGGNNDAELIVTVLPPNLLGWYSYKIVVKQKEQEYYNAYLPGILNGYPNSYIDSTGANNTTFEQGETSHIVLYNDNINKIPKDLDQVGPDETQYRSSIELFGRVKPVNNNNVNLNRQFYSSTFPQINGDIVDSILSLSQANFNNTTADGSDPTTFDINYPEFYQTTTGPSIARISTVDPIGKNNVTPPSAYFHNLAVYETAPRESLLDIYWETTSSGLIKDLNNAIIEGGYLGVVQTNGYVFDLSEDDGPGVNAFAGVINVVNGFSNVVLSDLTFTLVSVVDGNGTGRTSEFWLENYPGSGTVIDPQGFRSKTNSITTGQNNDSYFYYGLDQGARKFDMLVRCVYEPTPGEQYTSTIALNDLSLNNVGPTYINAIACPPTLIPSNQQDAGNNLPPNPITTINTPQVFEPTVIHTFYAQNGSSCLGGTYTNELTFGQISGNQLNSQFFELRTNENNPGVCELVLLPADVDPTAYPLGRQFDCYVRVLDAGGARANAYVNVTVTPVPQVSITVDSSPLCSPGGTWYAGSERTGDVRYRVTFDNLAVGATYNVTNSFFDNISSTGSIPAAPCGIPSSFVASAVTENYYFDVDYTSASGNPKISISITISDAGGDNVIMYSTNVFASSVPSSPLSTCPVGSPCV
jgi:hypothetical protein